MDLHGDDHKKTRPADIYIDNWGLVGKAAALDGSNTSRLKSEIILEAVLLLLLPLSIGNIYNGHGMGV